MSAWSFGQALNLPYVLDFEGIQTMPNNVVLVNVDGATPDDADLASLSDSAWVVRYSDTFEGNMALGVSYYNPEAGADDWLILPKVMLNSYTALTWEAVSLTSSGDYPDSYEIYISTTTQDVAGCQANGVLLTVTDEEARTSAGGAGVQNRKINLAKAGYANQEVYIAFRLMTPNPGGDRLAIDNIKIDTDPVAIEEDFNDGLPTSWTVINSNNDEFTWIYEEDYGLNESNSMAIQTWDANVSYPGDDYLISPKFIVSEGAVLSFWASSADADYPDNFTVLVSKTEATPTAFDITVGGESAVPNGYTKFQYVLTDNENIAAGDEIYIALYCSSEGYFLNVDDFRVGPYVPPTFIGAATLDENTLIVQYDSPLGESDINLADIALSGTADITFNNFLINTENPTVVFFYTTTALANDKTVDVLTNTADGNTTEFYAGILPLDYVSVTSDNVIESGIGATFKGTVVAFDADQKRIWINDEATTHNGVNTYGMALEAPLLIGDVIQIYGELDEYDSQTELYPATFINKLSSGATVTPISISGADIATTNAADTDPAEKYEGSLVKITGLKIKSWDGAYFTATDDDNATTFYVGNQPNVSLFEALDENTLTVDVTYNLTGVVINRGGSYILNPRDANDIEDVTGINQQIFAEFAATPNPVRTQLIVTSGIEMQSIAVYSIDGKELMKFENINTTNFTFDFSTFEKGVYVLKAQDADKNVRSMKVVRQ